MTPDTHTMLTNTFPIEYTALSALANGAKTFSIPADLPAEERFAARRVAHFMTTWRHILESGTLRTGLKASPGLVVSEVGTKENGAIVFVQNPSETDTVSGYVPPFLPEITLKPRTIFAYVHDAPIGEPVPGGKFLASYVGLVKSDAHVLAAHIRPAPFEGARLYVYGEPGETREVVLFHGSERGQGVQVTFADAPQVIENAAPSQIIALSTFHAGRTFFPADDAAPVIIGGDDLDEPRTGFTLAADGMLAAIAPETRLLLPQTVAQPGVYVAVLTTDDAISGTLSFDSDAVVGDVFVNDALVPPIAPGAPTFAVELVAGGNTIAATLGTGAVSGVTLLVDGACYVVNVAEWTYSAFFL